MTLTDVAIDPQCILPYTFSNQSFYYDLSVNSGTTVTYPLPTITTCDGRTFTAATTTLMTIAGSTTLPTFVTYDSTTQSLSVTLNAATDSINVGSYSFAVSYTMQGYFNYYLAESVNLVVMPAMTTDPRSPTQTITCTDNIYPFYIGGSAGDVFLMSM